MAESLEQVKKALRLVVPLVLLGFFVTFPHEGLHQLFAKLVGVDGTPEFFWGGYGRFNYAPGQAITGFQDAVIGLAGGLGTGIFLLLIWYLTGHPDVAEHPSEVDNSFPFLLWGINQVVYSPFDAWLGWVQWGNGLGVFVGFAVPLVLYWKAIRRWLQP